MPPRSPLPQRHGLDAAWLRTPDHVRGVEPCWTTMLDFLLERLPAGVPVAELLTSGAFVDQRGRPWAGSEHYRPNAFVWFHRPLRSEPVVPFDVHVLYADERIVVVDKPHFLATTPRGVHVRETALVRLREQLDLPDLAPAHRLDRLTAGVLLLTTTRQHRAGYATLFQNRQVNKTYEALAPFDPDLSLPHRVIDRIEKRRGSLQAEVVPGDANADTLIELIERRGRHARYRLTPSTGRTHQLRVHLATLGLPIVGDPLYPSVLDVAADDFTAPLQLIARRLSFCDPIDQTLRDYTSSFELSWPTAEQAGEPQ